MTALLHWSGAPVHLAPMCYLQKADYKPKGFWFDVDQDWKRWCEAESFNEGGFAYCYQVIVARDASLLHLRTAAELDRFTAQYTAPIYKEQGTDPHYCGIAWARVAFEYDGIVITPYCWERRMDLMWYYTWDCASGCIWNTAVFSIQPFERLQPSRSNTATPLGRNTKSSKSSSKKGKD